MATIMDEIAAIRELLYSGAVARWPTKGFATLAIEDELFGVQPCGAYALFADDCYQQESLLDDVDPWLGSEFANFCLEVKTGRIDCVASARTDNFVETFWQRWCEPSARISANIQSQGFLPVRCGFMPMSDEEMAQDWFSLASPRFFAFLRELGRRSGQYCVEVPRRSRKGSARWCVSAAPRLAGRTANLSSNASYNNAALAFDLHLALGWVSAVLSNSAGNGLYAARPDAWIYGMDSKGLLTGFAPPDGYLCQAGRSEVDSLLRWFDYVAQGDDILSPEEFGKPCGVHPFLQRKVSVRWMKSARMRWTVQDGQLELRIEDGFGDAQPTMLDGLALVLLIEGAKTKLLHDGIEYADQLLPVEEARRAHEDIRRNGPKRAEFCWRGSMRNPISVILEEIIPMAIEGLVLKGLERSFCERLFGLIQRQIGGKHLQTGSAWFRRRARVLGSESCALAEYARLQQGQVYDLNGELQGIADW